MTHDDFRRAAPALLLLLAATVWLAAGDTTVEAHGSEARYVEVAPWERERIPRVLAVSRSELGTPGTRRTMEVVDVEGRSCLVGALFALDVDDDYAFDVDEPVTLTLTYATGLTTPFVVGWDRNGGEGVGVTDEIAPAPGGAFASTTLTLDRARFAGRGVAGTDFAVSAREGIALCDVAVERSGETRPPTRFGRLVLDVRDGDGGPAAPARVGLYDATGRAPLPSDGALSIHRFTDEIRLLRVNARTAWPSSNRLAFYVDGSYESRLPAGAYELAVTRGPEYRPHRSAIEIRPDETTAVTVPLQRYADLPAAGWFSGDSHVHLMRDRPEDDAVWGQIAAEDLYVANLLEMGNVAGTHFKQPAWGRAGRYERDGRVLVSGQEDPRTGQRGHTMHWNIERPVHEPDSFFEYHEIFENTRRQGGVTGYAHFGELFNGPRGLALDVPFGLIDFIEVLQGGRLNTEIWYTFLNLGYRVLPVAGADFPYFGPHAARRRAHLRPSGRTVLGGRVVRCVPGGPRLRHQRSLPGAVGQRPADGRRAARRARDAARHRGLGPAEPGVRPARPPGAGRPRRRRGDGNGRRDRRGGAAPRDGGRGQPVARRSRLGRAAGGPGHDRGPQRTDLRGGRRRADVEAGSGPGAGRPPPRAVAGAALHADRSAAGPGDLGDGHDAGRAVARAAVPPRAPRGGGRPAVPGTAGTVSARRVRNGRGPAVIGGGRRWR